MNNFKGYKKTRSYFEGWYFKHQTDTDTICFIPGMSIDRNRNKCAFIQVITNVGSWYIEYPFSDFKACKDVLGIKIGNSTFMKKGIKIDIEDGNISIKGEIKYARFTPVKGDVMGIFKYFNMQCNHGVISMEHKLIGSLEVNGEQISFNNGRGYIEKDWGSSFPKTYLWIQCNNFKEGACSLMASLADVPFFGMVFKGCICVIRYKNTEFRLATYLGAKILRMDCGGFTIKQGRYCLKADVSKSEGANLFAPQMGNMKRTIKESALCDARFCFFKDDRIIFDLESRYAGFEYVR